MNRIETDVFDVVVVGAGNAALTAALAAQQQGAKVLVLEKAPQHLRGGNSYFTAGGFRFPFNGIAEISEVIPDLTEKEREAVDFGSYTQADFYEDLMRVTEGLADQELVNILVTRAKDTMIWMKDQGVRWVPMYGRQAFKVDGRFKFWGGLAVEAVGGGVGLVDQLMDIVGRAGIEIRYDSKGLRLVLDNKGRIDGLVVQDPDGFHEVMAKAVVLACGGFEANAEMRTRYLGPGWELAKVRGTQYNTGDGIRMALEIGAQPYGNWSGCHSVAWDVNAPPYGDRKILDLFQKHSYPLGIIVDAYGHRFVDEGADFRNYTYVKYGREILSREQRVAFQIFDEKTRELLRDEYRIPQVTVAKADTIGGLADKLNVDRDGLMTTVRDFNKAIQGGEFNPAVLDGKHTEGIDPPKSNWALPIDTPPYLGYSVTCGITFTFGGLRIDNDAQVLSTEERLIPGLHAAGELVGGLFYHNYPGGSGLMAGAVFGRIAGQKAAHYAGRDR